MRSKAAFPWRYLALAYGLSWLVWVPIALTRQDYQASPLLLAMMLLGVFGPGAAAIILTYAEQGRAGGRDFWRRATDWRHIRPLWWAVILLLWPALHGVAILVNRLLGVPPPTWAFVRQALAQPLSIPVVVILYTLQAGLEELGWRGYMQDRVQARWGPLTSALIVGVCHAFWHLPTFLIVGTNQIEYGFGVDFWIFVLFVIAMNVFSARCYNDNGRNTLAAILLHTTGNLSLDIFVTPGAQYRTFALVAILASLWIVGVWVRSRPGAGGRTERLAG